MDTSAPVRVERIGSAMVLTLQRDETRNALDTEMAQCLAAPIRDPGPGVRAIVITGAGRAFCAGGDLGYLVAQGAEGSFHVSDTIYGNFHALIRCILGSRVPLIAAINGPALGAGLDLAMACDLRIAAPRATFASAWIRLGLATGMGGSWLLARAIGGTRAAELLLLGESITASRAEQIGLINQVSGEDGLLDAALAIAAKLAALPKHGIEVTRASLRRALDMGMDVELQMLGSVQGSLIASEEFKGLANKFLKR